VRLFVAIEIPAAVRELIARSVVPLRKMHAPVKWEDESKLHVTLKFIGNQHESRVPAIISALQESAQEAGTSFQVRYSGTGMFPDRRHPRVFWIGTEDPEKRLSALHDSVDDRLHDAGIEKEKRNFHAHVTAGRATAHTIPRSLIDAWERLTLHTEFVTVSGFSLMQSDLRPEGSLYTVIGRFSLARSPQDSE
jgi:2'-5' RNA ligase